MRVAWCFQYEMLTFSGYCICQSYQRGVRFVYGRKKTRACHLSRCSTNKSVLAMGGEILCYRRVYSVKAALKYLCTYALRNREL